MSARRAFSLVEILIILAVIAVIIGLTVPFLGTARRTGCEMQNSSQLRGQHQGMVIYAQGNAFYLPGMGSNGLPLPAGLKTTGNAKSDGSMVGSRDWILLTGSFIVPKLLINPAERLTLWSAGAVTTANYSHNMLRITTTNDDLGRRAEWKDNANGAAVLISDRNIGTDNSDANVRSLFTEVFGDWRGAVTWGDNHVGFELSNRLTTTTIYHGAEQSHDNLFATQGAAGLTDNSTDSTANAFMTLTN